MVGVGIPSFGKQHLGLERIEHRNRFRVDARTHRPPNIWKDSPSVAYEHVAVNTTEGSLALDEEQIRENSSFVVLLEQPGRRTLTVASLAPTGLVDVSDGQEVATTPISTMFDRDFALVVGMVLVLSLAPAFVIHRELMTGSGEQKVSMNDEEE